MSAGLAASTVTPGSTPPDASRTTPAIEALSATCARAAAGASNMDHTTTTNQTERDPMGFPPNK